MEDKISIVVPVFNEEKNIRIFVKRLVDSILKTNLNYEIIFVLDPSTDKTEDCIIDEIRQNSNIKLICMSRRFGQPQATMAGIQNITGNRCVIIDCDLQDPPELIPQMNNEIDKGFDVVIAKRAKRKGETFVKKMVTKFGYLLINKISDIEIPTNSGDFRIISRRVINQLIKFNDKTAFLRGLISHIGFKQTYVTYDRDERYDGSGKYNRYFGSLKIALNGVFGFSAAPLFLISLTGLFLLLLTGLFIFIILYASIFLSYSFNLTHIIILFAIFLFGLNFLFIGIIGEYIGRIYDEVNKRPSYIIEKKINFE